MNRSPGWYPGVPRAVPAGGWLRQIGFRKMLSPARPAVQAYDHVRTAPIGGYGVAQTTVNASGKATISIGPSGLGTRWFPQQVTISTTSGAADASTAIGYLGPSAIPAAIVFTSYAGGGDTQGLAIPMMQPGDLLTVVWSGGKSGDTATLVIIGDQTVLSPI